MYLKGIYNISQLSSDPGKKPFIANRPIALDLYDQIEQLEPGLQQAAQERILNFAFSDGSYKKTHSNRFNDFDDEIISYLNQNLPKDKAYRFHDLAVSDGRTSLDFFVKLEKVLPNLDYLATDRNMFAYVFSDLKDKSKKIVKDENGKVLQIILPPFVFNIYSPKRAWRYKIKKAVLYPVNLIILQLLYIPLIRNFFIKIDESSKQQITLVQKDVSNLAKTKSNFHVSSHDMFKKTGEQYNIIRAMNVINFNYFTNEEVRLIADNICASLVEGGIFIVGSNKSAATPVNGDLIIKRNGQFESIKKFNDGAPFREILLATKYN